MKKSLHSKQMQIMLDLLKEIRASQGITQQLLETRINMPQSDISKVERGDRRLDLIELRMWLNGLDYPIQIFIDELEERLSAYEDATRLPTSRRSR